MSELQRVLDKQISGLSEMHHDDLIDLQALIERTHLHIMIERALRDTNRVSETQPGLRSIT